MTQPTLMQKPKFIHRYIHYSGVPMVTFSLLREDKDVVGSMLASYFDEWAALGYPWVQFSTGMWPSKYDENVDAEVELFNANIGRRFVDGWQSNDSAQGEITSNSNEQLKDLTHAAAEKLESFHMVTVVTEGVEYRASHTGSVLSVKVMDWWEEPNFVIKQFDFAEWKRYYSTEELPGVIQSIDVGYWYVRHDGETRYEEPVADCRGKTNGALSS